MNSTFDDTLPAPEEVEREFLAKVDDNLTAIAWLVERGISAPPPQRVALIQYGVIWNSEAGRYKFAIYGPEHIGPKYPHELAVPIMEDGKVIDLLVISDAMSFTLVTCRASWLGRKNLAQAVVRLHAHPMDWLEAGCVGVCHVAPISRKSLKELARAKTIECNDIETALEAWDWGFGGEDEELARFEVDDAPYAIQANYEREVRWHATRVVVEMERRDLW